MELEQHIKITDSLWRVTNKPFISNSYVVVLSSAQCLIIDPGLDSGSIDGLIARLGLVPLAVLCTHGHFDHVGTSSYFANKYGIKVYLNSLDKKVANYSNFLLMAFKINFKITLPDFEFLSVTEETPSVILTLGATQCRYVFVPGHTPGSCAIQVGDSLFTGDSLYARGVGLVSLPGEDVTKLKQSIRMLFKTYENDDVLVCPGHGEFDSLRSIAENNLALKKFLAE